MFMEEAMEAHKSSMIDLEVKETIDKNLEHYKVSCVKK
jgi:hypothetical protein